MRPARCLPSTAIAALLVSLLGACSGVTTSPEADMAAAPTASSEVTVAAGDATAAGIEVAPARIVERSDTLEASGVVTFDERRTARMGSLVEGVVHEIRVQPGDTVARGAVVARLHTHVVHDAWAAYFKAQAELQRLESELTFAKTAASRAEQLVEDRALSRQELERARADVMAAELALVAGRAEVTRTVQELEHYSITPHPDSDPREQEDVPVVAPFAGVVIERLATEGSAVTPGTPLLVISDLSRVWIAVEVDETLVGRVKAGSVAAIRTAAYPDQTFTGTLTAVGDVVNPTTRRVTLRIEAPNADRRLKPQMFVTATLGAAAPRRMLVVPAGAVQEMEGETVVFVRTGADRFARRAVTTGTDAGGEVEIVRGLGDGDMVVTAGAFLLKSELMKPAGEEP
ncbi:MAG: efflux RND transporter periplasmic adaptor subunit [Acidobacteriota bacterium]|nr:efflux RND transporter periplasmic adaptor subunit [Acidobacteriota bacterium]